jgi:hypothetical protein
VSDCPAGCDWEFDKYAEPRPVYEPGRRWPPLVWRGSLVVPSGPEPIDAAAIKGAATAAHLVDSHPDHAEVQRVFA